jgi:hypothetical protein
MDHAAVGPNAAEFVKNRVAMQQEHMQTIWREFDVAFGPSCRFSKPRSGVPMLQNLCDPILAADSAKPTLGNGTKQP